MSATLYYRGPDDEGVYIDEHIGLIHRRLSIRDLSAAARCPMSSPDKRVHVLLNGEIYNWRELREELCAIGSSFSTRSDTEVLLHGYQMWGEKVIPRLRGMFAVAIWDVVQQRLLLVRDRAGEKPLFYRSTSEGLTFASTIGAIGVDSGEREIESESVACHLVHGFIPSPRTIWKEIKVLPPAHMLSVRVGEVPVLRRYWDLPRTAPLKVRWEDAERAVDAALSDCVARCLDADVPVGVFLSGGVDSSLVASYASSHRPGIEAFSLGFEEAEYNEVPFARRVAECLGMPHHPCIVGVEDVIECLPHLVLQYGQPFGDASAVSTYLLSKFARERVKVCVSGDGGDEAFGGYWRMQAAVYAGRYAAVIPGSVRSRIVPWVAGHMGLIGERWVAMNSLSLKAPCEMYTNAESWYTVLADVAGPRLLPALQTDLVALRVGRSRERCEASTIQKLLYDDFQVQLPDAYLAKIDVASMAASLEVRAPFLDKAVVELAWGLPDSMKLNWTRRKWLLKRLASRKLPSDLMHRPKMGFSMPLPGWFRTSLGNVLEGLLEDSVAVADGWLCPDLVRQYLRAHREGADHAERLWLILWLELWFRIAVHQTLPDMKALARSTT